MIVREYTDSDLPTMIRIWNEVVDEGIAFPQEDMLNERTGTEFFGSQTYCGVAEDDGKVVGLYILHPNNIGRCGHMANCSYAVSAGVRGKHIGEKLVSDSLVRAKEQGFRIIQFNAVVDDGEINECEYEDTDSFQVTELFINNREQLLKRLLGE